MTATTAHVITTTCSGCSEDVVLKLAADLSGTARVVGKVAPVSYDGGDKECELVMWDCPSCDYADSFDRTF